jgi:hypothetical protein
MSLDSAINNGVPNPLINLRPENLYVDGSVTFAGLGATDGAVLTATGSNGALTFAAAPGSTTSITVTGTYTGSFATGTSTLVLIKSGQQVTLVLPAFEAVQTSAGAAVLTWTYATEADAALFTPSAAYSGPNSNSLINYTVLVGDNGAAIPGMPPVSQYNFNWGTPMSPVINIGEGVGGGSYSGTGLLVFFATSLNWATDS